MDKVVDAILKQNKSLFGEYKKILKINIGFTNTIYNVDDKYIIKICTDLNNEEKFKKEINFYNSNNYDFIPKLYFASTDKIDIPYMYEIIEKIDGVPLFDIWHTFSEELREETIKKLCEIMKKLHSNIGESYDWVKKTSDLFVDVFNKAKSLNLFDEEELKLLEKAYAYFPKFLNSNEFVLVHNDLHFDNIFYKDGIIKIIDFERMVYAPRDFELDIIYRMIRKPWKFASQENEKYTKLSDYQNIMTYIEKYYPELLDIDNLYKRLAIYDIVYYLKQYVNYPKIIELKDDILKAANVVINF